MSNLVITKQTGNFFSLVLDGGEPIISEKNRLTTVGDFCNFKTANGANLILKQNILVEEITVVASGTFTFTNTNELWDKLIEVGFFDGTLVLPPSGITRFDELEDTFSYFGRDGQVLIVNESEQKLETQAISLFTSEDETKLNGIEANAQKNVNPDWNKTDPSDPATILNKPDEVSNLYPTKSESQTYVYTEASGNVNLPIQATRLNVAQADVISDLNDTTGNDYDWIWDGMPFYIYNDRTDLADVLIDGNSDSTWVFLIPNDTNTIALKHNEMVMFKSVVGGGNKYFDYVGIIRDQISDIEGLDDALNLKLNISDYNDRFKGKYTSLANLQSAHPTSNDGDYAIVDAGSGVAAQEYIWDANEGWVLGTNVGATTTDALPEGSVNKYFTTARVLATVLSGISFVTGTAITATDTVLQAFGKIQKQINDIISTKQDQLTAAIFGAFINTLASKATQVDADKDVIYDSVTGTAKSVLFSDRKSTLLAYFLTKFALKDGFTSYHTTRRFTPTGTVTVTGGVNIATSVGQFFSTDVGAQLTINGDQQIISAYIDASHVTVANAYSQNYTAVSAANWGVYARNLLYSSGNFIINDTNNFALFTFSNTGIITINNAPVTSAGAYNILTYNTGTKNVEKILSSSILDTTSAQTVSVLKTFLDGMIGFRNVANTFTSFRTNSNTASRTYTDPDKSGTVALLDDVTNAVGRAQATASGTALTLDLTHTRKRITISHGFNVTFTVTVPNNSTVPFTIGDIVVLTDDGAQPGLVSVVGASGVTLIGVTPATRHGGTLILEKVAINTWRVSNQDFWSYNGSYLQTTGGVGFLVGGATIGTLSTDITYANTVYTVATLPTPPGATKAYATVSDALTPAYLAPVVGGGAVVCPVFYNGTTWVCH
jgi:hypothetical protein